MPPPVTKLALADADADGVGTELYLTVALARVKMCFVRPHTKCQINCQVLELVVGVE